MNKLTSIYNEEIGIVEKAFQYDCLNNKIYEGFKINYTTNKIIHYVYDKVGNLIEKKEEIDGKFISSKNKGKNIWSITKYEYDKNGNLTKVITPKGYEIVKVYYEIDRVIEEQVSQLSKNQIRKGRANEIINRENAKLGPAVAGILDTKTGKIFTEINSNTSELPINLNCKLEPKIMKMPKNVQQYY